LPTGEHNITSYRNTVFIYNLWAGRFGRQGSALAGRITAILTASGHNVTVAPTAGPGSAGAIARRHIERGADLIVVAGGDGTINEIAEGMVHSNVPLAVLPAGTANVLATEMRLGSGRVQAARRLEDCRPQRISVGQVTCNGAGVSRHFVSMAGIGLDAQIVRHVNGDLKAQTGKLAYWLAAWSLVASRLAEFHVEVDGRQRKCSFALVSKVRNYGGDFRIAPSVTLLDDRFEVVLFEGRYAVRYVKYFAGLVVNRLVGMKGITVMRAESVKLFSTGGRQVYVQTDGELACHLPAELRIVPHALTLMVPADYTLGTAPGN